MNKGNVNHPTNQSINQSIRICATCWLIVGKKRISRKWCVNSPERLLCLFLVYRLQETWLWGTVQRRSSEKRRTAIKTVSERTDDNWISSTSPSLRPLTMRQRRWKGFASSLPLLCKSVPFLLNETPCTSAQALWTFSVLLAHALFPLRIRCAQSPDREIRAGQTQTKTRGIP